MESIYWIKAIQDECEKILSAVHKVFVKRGIKYSISSDTLLG